MSSVYDPALAQSVASRYSDAYLVGRAVNGFGDGIKIFGIVIAALLAMPALRTPTAAR
jgi:hypothetical protein